MKKIISIIMTVFLSLCLSIGLAACGGDSTVTPSGDVLVIYFSASGNTERIANYIAEITGGTTFEIEPVVPYTSADLRWTDSSSRVVQEHNDPNRNVELTTTQVENWEDYETVFIGYPIWWQEASWVVDNFIKDNDFTGKTVIPFCTSSSSRLGKSGELLAQMAGTGDWKEGKRFSSSASKSDVEEWIALE